MSLNTTTIIDNVTYINESLTRLRPASGDSFSDTISILAILLTLVAIFIIWNDWEKKHGFDTRDDSESEDERDAVESNRKYV